MRVISVNTGTAAAIGTGRRRSVSGINKRAAAGGVFIGATGLTGDAVCDEEHHGGVDQAVYAYGAADYAWWSEELGLLITPGTFGENLTIEGLPSNMNAGDRLLIGDVVLEATAPRIPCETLSAQMRDSGFGLKFRRAERPGFYFRVLHEGGVAAGETVTVVPYAGSTVSMLELFRLAYEISPESDALRRAIAAPIATRMRGKLEQKLAATD